MIFIYLELFKFNFVFFVYEYLCLAFFMIKIYDCDFDLLCFCNDEMFDCFGVVEDLIEEEFMINLVWDELKKLGNNN